MEEIDPPPQPGRVNLSTVMAMRSFHGSSGYGAQDWLDHVGKNLQSSGVGPLSSACK